MLLCIALLYNVLICRYLLFSYSNAGSCGTVYHGLWYGSVCSFALSFVKFIFDAKRIQIKTISAEILK